MGHSTKIQQNEARNFFEDDSSLRTRAIDHSLEGMCKEMGKNLWLNCTSGQMVLPGDLETKEVMAQVIFSPEKRVKL